MSVGSFPLTAGGGDGSIRDCTRSVCTRRLVRQVLIPGFYRGSESIVAKQKSREYVWLQCTETGDLNYRTQIKVKGGLPEKLKEKGLKKYSPRLRKHTVHKIKRK
ncbi:MAG: 50S ribosomal protein L33 [Planctomycetes bacterium]|jgi:large subunit ribosomal protein L33|nr:50S ribosomal protein L33 [Planctomycetota bacterium]MBT6453783.1 50S ribosomal protein L33 [Planctomycetota bacterium]MBT6541305.1 50S ribosomal protein L33 [Planctomycetota bacterium]MBT6783484.1 50S ribosomal protein L33 [Planctomycetota bacterium]MBT6969013.1 50S ribosomal protein L33 [Planctomycetota bacterium]